jgi:hypothetical protein
MKYCVDCGFVGKPKLIIPVRLSIEIALWLFPYPSGNYLFLMEKTG